MPSSTSEPHAIIIPISQLAEGEPPIVRRGRGRPRKVRSAPLLDERVYEETMAALAEHAMDDDPVVHAATKDDSLALLERAMREVAVESASLRWERELAVRQGRLEAASISSRRAAALARLADLTIERERLRALDPEPQPHVVEKLKTIFFTLTREAAEETMPEPVAEKFLARLDKKLSASASTATPATAPSTTT